MCGAVTVELRVLITWEPCSEALSWVLVTLDPLGQAQWAFDGHGAAGSDSEQLVDDVVGQVHLELAQLVSSAPGPFDHT